MKKKNKNSNVRTKEQRYKLKGFLYYLLTTLCAGVFALTGIFAFKVDFSTPTWTVSFVVGILLLVLAGFYTLRLFRFIVLLLRCNAYHDYVKSTMNDYVRMKQGCSGTGKSSSGVHESVYMAEVLEATLRMKYWELSHAEYRTEEQEEDFQEVKKAYDFYTELDNKLAAEADARIASRNAELEGLLQDMKCLPRGRAKRDVEAEYRRKRKIFSRQNAKEIRGCIWCLWSNIPIRVGNRMSVKANVKHLVQLKPLPVYTILFWDELGNTLAKHGFSQIEITQFIEELCRYVRHYGEFRFIFTEQEGNNVLIGARKNIAFMDYFTRPQQSVMNPPLFVLADGFIEWAVNKLDYQIECKSTLYTRVNELAHNIGFRKFTVMRIGNQEQAGAGKVLTKERTRVAPATLNGEYSSRTYRKGYKAKDKAIDDVTWERLELAEVDIEFERELRENLISKPSDELLSELGVNLTKYQRLSIEIADLDIDYDRVNCWIKQLFNKKRPVPINKLTDQQFEELLEQVENYRQRYQQVLNAIQGSEITMKQVQIWLQRKMKKNVSIDLLEVSDMIFAELLQSIKNPKLKNPRENATIIRHP